MSNDLINYLGSLLTALAYLILVPIYNFFTFIVSTIYTVLNAFISLVNAIIGLTGNLVSNITNYITGLFPVEILSVILIGLAIVIFQRLYFYLKDVSIFGFKI